MVPEQLHNIRFAVAWTLAVPSPSVSKVSRK
jgi:hypothetical protein